LKLTPVTPDSPEPPIVTQVPGAPLSGETHPTDGGGATTVKIALLAADPFFVVTTTGPLVAPAGTCAVI
jgi:hypothetical protein